MRRVACGMISLMILGDPVLAQDPGQPAPVPEEEIKVTGKQTCKMETSLGSMMPRRVCRTKSQSRADARSTADGLARFEQIQQIQDIQRQAKCRGEGSAC